jgi:hypothetical protein
MPNATMPTFVTPEAQTLCWILRMHVRGMSARLRQIPEDKWDWTFAPPAPTPRVLASHTWQWLICDRQHIEELDALKHALVPEPPSSPANVCDALDAEMSRWEALLPRLTPEDLDAPRHQFNDYPMTVRTFIGHIVQNSIYKSGQLATLYFALGLDGDAPYAAPFPNPIYAELHAALHKDQANAS